MGRHSLNKGKRGEREAAAEIRKIFGTDASRGRQYQGGDDSPDINTGITDVHFEVKRVESLRLYPAMEQAKNDAGPKLPVVLHRKNSKPWLAIVRLEDLPLLAFLIHEVVQKDIKAAQESVSGKARMRQCLKCQKDFSSSGPGNRICKRCTRINNSRYPNLPDACIDKERGRKFHNGDPIP